MPDERHTPIQAAYAVLHQAECIASMRAEGERHTKEFLRIKWRRQEVEDNARVFNVTDGIKRLGMPPGYNGILVGGLSGSFEQRERAWADYDLRQKEVATHD